jgi:hypothetical protein
MQEIFDAPMPVILFIDEAHTLIGAGNTQGGLDVSNLLKPALARGELKTIAATTWREYKKYIEKDAALTRRACKSQRTRSRSGNNHSRGWWLVMNSRITFLLMTRRWSLPFN